jgi:hypothetical protein
VPTGLSPYCNPCGFKNMKKQRIAAPVERSPFSIMGICGRILGLDAGFRLSSRAF